MVGSRGVSRRTYLSGITLGATSLAGCVNRLRPAVERQDAEQVEVGILTVPEDEDLYSLRIANHLAKNLDAAGIAVEVQPTRRQTMLQDVLINRDFDIFVGRYSDQYEADFLYPLFHSRFGEESGWQNFSSYSNSVADEMLVDQRRGEGRREDQLGDLQRLLATEVPIIPIAHEHFKTLVAPEIAEIHERDFTNPAWWATNLNPGEGPIDEDQTVLEVGSIDNRISRNLNPIAVDYRGAEGLTEVIYDPLTRWENERHIPWLAAGWEWLSPVGAVAPTIEVSLREGLVWHDGEPIDASDVDFTFALLRNTTLTEQDPTLPAPRFRGRSSLIDTTEVIDDRTIRIQFKSSSREVALWAMTIPILPMHIWEDRTDKVEIAGIQIADQTTEAMVHENILPVGSGQYECIEVDTNRSLLFERFDDHFLEYIDDTDPAVVYDHNGFDYIHIELHPSERTIVEAIREGELDTSLTNLGAELISSAGEEEPSLEAMEVETSVLLHIGFNLRRVPFTSVGFRQAIAGLMDRNFLESEVFVGGADPTVTPLSADAMIPQSLQWPAEPIGFLGEAGSGEINVEAARDEFRNAGFQYSGDGELLTRE